MPGAVLIAYKNNGMDKQVLGRSLEKLGWIGLENGPAIATVGYEGVSS